MTLRVIGAVTALVSSGIHLWQYFAGFDHEGVAIPFLINVAAGIVIAVLLLTWNHWVPLFLLCGLGAATLVAFAIAATWGLLGVHEHWGWFPQWLSTIVDVVAILVWPVAGALGRVRMSQRASEPVASGTAQPVTGHRGR